MTTGGELNMDYSAMTDEELSAIQRDATAEQSRRAFLSGVPMQISELAEQYREGGGEQGVLEDAVAERIESA